MAPLILIVDDDTLIRRIMRDTLLTVPANVVEATNGEEAVKVARTERPDLIFIDTMMPGLDGFQTAEILKQDPLTAPIPLVFVSALGTSSHKVRGLDLGAEDYIAKPIDPEELKARVRSILRRTRSAAPPPAAAPQSAAKGQLHSMPLPSLVRWLEMEHRSARLVLSRGPAEGEIVFREGRITHARQDPRRGNAALYHVLSWEDGTFNIMPPPVAPLDADCEVSGGIEELLQESARRLKETAALSATFPAEALLEVPGGLRASIRAELPAGAAGLLEALDGTRPLDRLLQESPLDAWTTLTILQALLAVGALGWADAGRLGPGRRSIPRVPLEESVEFHPLPPAQQSNRYTLSSRGIFIQTDTPLEVGSRVLIRVQFPGSPVLMPIVGQVIWKNADPAKFKPEDLGMGLQFLDVAGDQLDAVERQLANAIAGQIRKLMP
jgi:two-component system, OmpR family, alkaline phosphatase synthesis response regulator PhoP